MTLVQTWIAAIGTIAVFSYLYGDNPLWRVSEHIYVGLATAWTIAYQFHSYIKPFVLDDLAVKGSYSLIIPALLGLLIYTRYFPGVGWLARYPLSFWIGYGAGYVLAFTPAVNMQQITASFIQLNHINAFVVLFSLLATLMYFFFTIRREGVVMKYGASLGRYAIMVGLGANFGSTMLYRFSLFLARVQFLLGDWLHIV